jgi:hypothetical protein
MMFKLLLVALSFAIATASPTNIVQYVVDTYEYTIFTGNAQDAGTDSEVRLEIFGDNGSSGLIFPGQHGALFEAGNEDSFEMQHMYLGTLRSMLIGHDNSGKNSSWFLEKVEVYDTLTTRCYAFFYNNWIDTKTGDLYREIQATSMLPSQCSFTSS